MKLLIVEDEPAQIQLYKDNIESFNKTSDIQITYDKFLTLEKAKDSLLSPEYDGAIIDLKLSQGTEELEGLEIVEEIEQNQRFPIFIVSGSISSIDDKEENTFFKKRNRDSNFKTILSELVEIYQTGITNILGRKGEIEEYLTSIFWNHLSNSMDLWVKDTTRTPEEKQKSLLRYTLSHIQEYIDEDIEKYHPSEFYITAPIKMNIFTGDIVFYQDNRYLVLTPSCDIVKRTDGNRNANRILFCKIINLKDGIKNFELLKSDTSINNENRKRLNSFIENKKQNYHFVPKSNLIDAGLIDFQDKLTIETKNVEDLLRDKEMIRIATVSGPFLKDIISRFTNYFSRQGSPDFNVDEIYNSLFDE
jgi:CheY-like chemotaxis protein